jgi:hypothetical protein
VREDAVAQPTCFPCEKGFKIIVSIPIYGEPSASDEGFEPNAKKKSRRGIPVRNAYALTVHKSQGQSFLSVCMHVDDIRAKLAADYVGMSRATSTGALKLWEDLKKYRLIRVGWSYVNTFLAGGKLKKRVRKKPIQRRVDFLDRVSRIALAQQKERGFVAAPAGTTSASVQRKAQPSSAMPTPSAKPPPGWRPPETPWSASARLTARAPPPFMLPEEEDEDTEGDEDEKAENPIHRGAGMERFFATMLCEWGLRLPVGDDSAQGWGPPPTQPQWLRDLIISCGGFIGEATVIDFYCSGQAHRVKRWLEFLGFKLGRCDIDRHLQFSNTCAFVSSHVASMQGRARNWADVDAAQAADDDVWRRGYEEVLRAPCTPSAFRSDDDIRQLLSAWDSNENGYDQVFKNSLDFVWHDIATFVRALAYSKGIVGRECFRRNSRVRNGETENSAERLITNVMEGTITFPRRIITNTSTSSGGGVHWFNIALSVHFEDL